MIYPYIPYHGYKQLYIDVNDGLHMALFTVYIVWGDY
jgi:hypothetical protein